MSKYATSKSLRALHPLRYSRLATSRPAVGIGLRQFSASASASAKYPTAEEIEAFFKPMEKGETEGMFARVEDDVDWTVMGTHPLAGRYTSKVAFQKATFARLAEIMKPPGIQMKVRNVFGGGEQPYATVELVASATCKNGLEFPNTYAWVLKFNEKGNIAQVRAYLDSAMVHEAIVSNEVPDNRAPVET